MALASGVGVFVVQTMKSSRVARDTTIRAIAVMLLPLSLLRGPARFTKSKLGSR